MKSNTDKILIISNTFPPNQGIGGRRWAKFAKYIHLMGKQIFVFTSTEVSDSKSPWTKDVESLEKEDRIIRVKNTYPKILDSYPSTFFSKLTYRIALIFLQMTIKGNFYDRSSLWKSDLLSKLEDKIKDGYLIIIATGAPFRYLHHLIKLKKKYPALKLIADFRDPWTNNRIAYGFDTLPEKRMQEELIIEKEILQQFDAIVSVYDSHIEYLKTVYPDGNYFMIPNGFDPDDCKLKEEVSKRDDEKIRFVYTGTLYLHSEYIFKDFVASLISLKETNPVLFHKMEFHFYGNKYPLFDNYFSNNDLVNTLFYHGTVSLERVYKEIQNADICMLFLTDQMNYTKNTKFYEYMYMRKKIAVFSSPGFLEKYVVDNELGYSLTPGNINMGFKNIELDFINRNLNVSEDYDVDQYGIPKILETYITNIISD